MQAQLITKMKIEHYKHLYRATLKGYLPKYATTRHEAIRQMLLQIAYWNMLKK